LNCLLIDINAVNDLSISDVEADNINMIFNASQSKVLRIGNRYNNSCTALSVDGRLNVIPFVNKAGYLDVYISALKMLFV